MQNISLQSFNTSTDSSHGHGLSSSNERQQMSQRGLANDESVAPSFVLSAANPKIIQPLIIDETKSYMTGGGGEYMQEDDDSEGELAGMSVKDEKVSEKKSVITKKTRGRVRIKMEFIQNKLRRYTTFSKRKTGIMKKAYELSTLTGTQVMLLVASETGHVYTFATRKLQPMITSESGKALIQTCLNSPDPTPPPAAMQQATPQPHIETVTQTIHPEVTHAIQPQPADANNQRMSETGYEEPDLQYPNTEEESKTGQNSSTSTPTIQYVTQTTQSFPLNNYIVSSTKPVQVGSITTIFTPAAGGSGSSSPTVTLQPTQTATVQQPQIISGQLQLHRIHPQNILLTGNSPIQQSHIILNQSPAQPAIVVSNTAGSSTSANRIETSTPSQQQDVITFVSPGQTGSTGQILQVYSASSGNVLYAQPSQSGIFKRISETSDQITMQHTPVIQASSDVQQGTSVVISRQDILDAEGLVVPRNPNNLSK